MIVLVTGAAGYVGNNTVRRLVQAGHSVRAMVRSTEKATKRLADVAGKIEIVQGDVTDRESLQRVMEGVNAVVHTVAIPMERGKATYEEINYQGTINVVNAAEAVYVQRFINVSQNGAAPDHFSAFLRSKGKAQQYVASSKLPWTAVRPSVIFGPQDEFFNSIARLVRLTPLVFPLIGGGKAEFQPVSVYDVAEVIARCLNDDEVGNGTIGKALELGGPEVLTMGEIERRILHTMNARRLFFPAPAGLLKLPVLVMEKLLPGTPVNTTLLELLKVRNVVNDNALVSLFKMQPRPFSGDNIAYLRENTAGQALKKFLTGATVS